MIWCWIYKVNSGDYMELGVLLVWVVLFFMYVAVLQRYRQILLGWRKRENMFCPLQSDRLCPVQFWRIICQLLWGGLSFNLVHCFISGPWIEHFLSLTFCINLWQLYYVLLLRNVLFHNPSALLDMTASQHHNHVSLLLCRALQLGRLATKIKNVLS